MATGSILSSSSSSYSSAGDVPPAKADKAPEEDQELVDINGMVSQFSSDEEALIDKTLPRELLLRVFSFLDVVSLCRAAQRDINSALVQRLSSRTGGFLHALKLRGCRSLTDDALTELTRSCPNLETLDLNDCRSLTDATCAAIASNCFTLIHLNLSGLVLISDASLEALSTSPLLTSKLRHLDLSFCPKLTSAGLIKLLTPISTPVSPLNGFSHLNDSPANVSPKVSNATRPLSNLNFFAAKMDTELATDASITLLTSTVSTSLKTLLLNKCSNLTDEAVAAIGQNCPQLTTLSLSSCQQITDASAHSLAAGTPLLTTLEIASCPQLTDNGLAALARGCRQLFRIDLEEVNLITDSTVSALANHCPQLATLTLSHCELVTDEGLRSLVQAQASNPHLKVLELDNCPLITDEGLSHLSTLTSLQRLEIYDCQLLTRPGIRMIRSALPSLKVHAYFAPITPPLVPGPEGVVGADPLGANPARTICRCCTIL